jgi:hypothetical protein
LALNLLQRSGDDLLVGKAQDVGTLAGVLDGDAKNTPGLNSQPSTINHFAAFGVCRDSPFRSGSSA